MRFPRFIGLVLVWIVALVAGLEAAAGRGEGDEPMIWFNHDGTYILTTMVTGGEPRPFSEELFRESIDELGAAGVDVISFSPGNGSVPWWQSKVNDHWEWFTQRTGKKPGVVGQYVMEGGDLVQAFVEQARKHGIRPVISIRLKDEHHIEKLDSEWVSRFYFEHQDWRLDSSPRAVFGQRGLNWIYPEVPGERLAVIRELAENYAIDGIELDFMRFPPFFDLSSTTIDQREAVMTGFIQSVREIMDRTQAEGARRILALRVPNRLKEFGDIGLNLAALDQAKLVDVVSVSPSYVSQVESDIEEMVGLAPAISFLYEITHAASRGPSPSWGEGGDDYPIRVVTDEQFYTAANLAYAKGAEGISLFNFTYMRPAARSGTHAIGGSIGREPPWHLIDRLRDPEWLAAQPQNYWIPYWWKTGYHGRQFQLPIAFTVGEVADLELDLALPKVPITGGKLRIRTAGATPVLSATEPIPYVAGRPTLQWAASLNGVQLEPTNDVSEPFDEPYQGFLGDAEDYSAWLVPARVLKSGTNSIRVELQDGPISDQFQIQLIWVDLAVFTQD